MQMQAFSRSQGSRALALLPPLPHALMAISELVPLMIDTHNRRQVLSPTSALRGHVVGLMGVGRPPTLTQCFARSDDRAFSLAREALAVIIYSQDRDKVT